MRHRARNNVHVREARDRKQSEFEKVREQYKVNEERIEVLEKTCVSLANELASKPPKATSKKRVKKTSQYLKEGETRPEWFGQAF